jgi:hypothetical protein
MDERYIFIHKIKRLSAAHYICSIIIIIIIIIMELSPS